MLQGNTPRTLPPLDLTAGTAFRQAVWNLAPAIPGSTVQTMVISPIGPINPGPRAPLAGRGPIRFR